MIETLSSIEPLLFEEEVPRRLADLVCDIRQEASWLERGLPAQALLEIADPGRIFYGSDWPFTPLPIVTRLAGEIDNTALFDAAMRRGVLHDNALTLFPRLRG